jgi:hypothetical protein
MEQSEYRRLKTRLTTKQNKLKAALAAAADVRRTGEVEDILRARDAVLLAAQAVVTEANSAQVMFDEQGYPDSWANWDRAKADAELQLRHRGIAT